MHLEHQFHLVSALVVFPQWDNAGVKSSLTSLVIIHFIHHISLHSFIPGLHASSLPQSLFQPALLLPQ